MIAVPSPEEGTLAEYRQQFRYFIFFDLLLALLLGGLAYISVDSWDNLSAFEISYLVSVALYFFDFLLMGWLQLASKDCVRDSTSLMSLKPKAWANFVFIVFSIGAFFAVQVVAVVQIGLTVEQGGLLIFFAYMGQMTRVVWSFTKWLDIQAQRNSTTATEPFTTQLDSVV